MFIRKSQYKIEDLILKRWSPRALSGESIKHEEFMRLIEAAHWAPSSYNGQPWRFVYAHRDTPAWQKIFDLMIPFNQVWAKNAAVLVVLVSLKNFEFNGKPARTHSFDAGAAWENLSLQGCFMNLVVHGMEGFDYEKARKDLNVPDGYEVELMFAVGKPGRKEDLPKELQEREEPSDRKPAQEIIFEGQFQQIEK